MALGLKELNFEQLKWIIFSKCFLEAGHLNNRDLILARMFLEWADQMVELTHSEKLSG